MNNWEVGKWDSIDWQTGEWKENRTVSTGEWYLQRIEKWN